MSASPGEFSGLDAEQRVAAFFVSLAVSQSRRGLSATLLAMPLTREQIGQVLGISMETVSRACSGFMQKHWIRSPAKGCLELLEPAALGTMAAGMDGH